METEWLRGGINLTPLSRHRHGGSTSRILANLFTEEFLGLEDPWRTSPRHRHSSWPHRHGGCSASHLFLHATSVNPASDLPDFISPLWSTYCWPFSDLPLGGQSPSQTDSELTQLGRWSESPGPGNVGGFETLPSMCSASFPRPQAKAFNWTLKIKSLGIFR